MIVCVEDDASIRNMMVYALAAAGFSAVGCEDGAALDALLAEECPELLLLDIMLPGEDGLSILSRLRADGRTADLPIIMTTARGTEYDKVLGLDTGADDYLAKPFGMMEMLSRVRALLRRTHTVQGEAPVLRNGALSLRPAEHTAYLGDERLALTKKEYELLRLFLENPGRVFTREALLSAVWGEEFLGETRTVDVHIGTLRTKLSESGALIETVRGVGYRMEGEA